MSIYFFRNSVLLHDGGHVATTLVASLLLAFVAGFPWWVACIIGCTLFALLLEFIDVYAGGLIVTHEQRIKILQSRVRSGRGFKPSPDNVKDFANYQVPWAIFLVGNIAGWPTSQIIGGVVAVALFIIQFLFYKKKLSW